jgi:hypothetical protein
VGSIRTTSTRRAGCRRPSTSRRRTYATEPPLDAEHYIRPRPGRLVLFPSYMWHGTVPFTTAERRMTIAFDIVPA